MSGSAQLPTILEGFGGTWRHLEGLGESAFVLVTGKQETVSQVGTVSAKNLFLSEVEVGRCGDSRDVGMKIGPKRVTPVVPPTPNTTVQNLI